MPHLSAEAKHHILLEYSPHDTTRTFAALARRHAIKGGAQVIRLWHRRWNGTPASLQEQQRSGRPRVLSRAQVQRHIATPLRHANRAHRAIHYTDLLPRVRAATGTEVSLRTVRRYGKEELGAKKHKGIKRTAEESKQHSTSECATACVPRSSELINVCSGSCPV
jgi:transposase